MCFLSITLKGELTAEVIDKDMLIDQHYYGIHQYLLTLRFILLRFFL